MRFKKNCMLVVYCSLW